MRNLFATAAILAMAASSAMAAEPSVLGDWLDKDGYANIRIDNCGGKMWGIVVWEKVPGTDSENPDPAKKNRPTLGMPVLMGLGPVKEQPGKWTGEIYNSQNGKMYGATISLASEDTLNLEGCLFPNFLCMTQQWTRVKAPPAGASPLPPIKGATALPTKQAAAKKGAVPAQSEVCQRVAAEESHAPQNTRK